MADYKHQQQDLQAGLQHLANRQQEASAIPATLVHQQRTAMAEIQALERQRLYPHLVDLETAQHQL